jgi:hypothetical protein
LGLLLAAIGWNFVRKAADTTFAFLGHAQRLVIASRRERRVVPLADVVRAEVGAVGSSEGPGDVYDLQLVLRGGGECVAMTDFNNMGVARLEAIAAAINAFLAHHCPAALDEDPIGQPAPFPARRVDVQVRDVTPRRAGRSRGPGGNAP